MIKAYRINKQFICDALNAMNGKWDCFESEVIRVDSNYFDSDNYYIVFVKTKGDYPYITNQWERYIDQPDKT